MITKIVSIIKKWTSGRPSRIAAQKTTNPGELNSQKQRDLSPNTDQAETLAELDEDTANGVVATWNLLNPP